MAAIVTQSNMSGFPGGVPGDNYNSIGILDRSFYLDSAYQGSTISVNLGFTVQEPGLLNSIETFPVISVTPTFTNINGLVPTILSSSSVRISGTIINVFGDEYYNFLMRTLQTRTLPAINSEDYLALIEYHPPATKEVLRNYGFTVVYGPGSALSPGGSLTVTMSQYIYWNYYVSLNTFQTTLATGEI